MITMANKRLDHCYDLLSQHLEQMLEKLDQPLNAQDLKRMVDSQAVMKGLLRDDDPAERNVISLVLQADADDFCD